MAPLVGDFNVLHGGDCLARVRVHHLYGDVDERFLAVGQHKVRAHLAVHFCVISLRYGRHGGVVYARVECIVRLACSYIKSRREEALVGDAHLQVLDGRKVFTVFYQVEITFHIIGYEAVTGERTGQGDCLFRVFFAYIQNGGCVVSILLVGLAVCHIAVG